MNPSQNETDRSTWDEQGYTDLFEQEGRLWGFPPNGVMPVPLAIVRRTPRFNLTDIPPRPISSGFPSMLPRVTYLQSDQVENIPAFGCTSRAMRSESRSQGYILEDSEILEMLRYQDRLAIARRRSDISQLSGGDLSQSIQTPIPESEQPEL
jgi:hypothetical protein